MLCRIAHTDPQRFRTHKFQPNRPPRPRTHTLIQQLRISGRASMVDPHTKTGETQRICRAPWRERIPYIIDPRSVQSKLYGSRISVGICNVPLGLSPLSSPSTGRPIIYRSLVGRPTNEIGSLALFISSASRFSAGSGKSVRRVQCPRTTVLSVLLGHSVLLRTLTTSHTAASFSASRL